MRHKEEKGVISIIAVLSIGIFALGTSLVLAQGVLQQMIVNRSNVSTYQAFYTAESGAGEGAYQFLKSDTYTGSTLAVLINSTSGDISVTSPSFGVAEVRGKSEKNGSHREVFYKVVKYPDGLAFSYGIYTPNAVCLKGSSSVTGNVFATNGAYPSEDGSSPINCSGASAESHVHGGTIIEHEPPDPPIVNSVPYKNAANSVIPKTYFTSVSDAENTLKNNTINSVVFIENNTATASITGNNTQVNGALWVSGDLELKGGTFTRTGDYFAVVVKGDLKLNGNVTINGIVYVKGDVTLASGTTTITGSLICVGNSSVVDATGNFTVIYQDMSHTWSNLVGLQLNCNGLCPGKIDNWGER